ncbi:MAG: hypothetical protein ABR951_06265 [Candidatus Aminicenantales bacterium]|jgi:hypothetical protein
MHRIPCRRVAAGVIVFMAAAFVASAAAGLSLKEILVRNVQASGGKARIGQVKNLSFKTGVARNIVSAAGELKVLTGKDPVVTEVVLVNGDKVRRNSLNVISDVPEPERTVYRTLAKLYAGVFSLAKFEGQLKLEGLKSFGAAKLYHLRPKVEGGTVGVHFYLDADDFRLKRLVFQGATPEGDKYEVNYDFAPFEEAEGLSLPLSWFVSQVGTRGNVTGVTELKANLPLARDFFTKTEINAGRTESAPGEMKGNVLEFNSSPFGLSIATNWTKKDVDNAGFRTGDKLILLLEGDESEIAFYALANEVPPPDELAKGARLLAPMPRGGEGFAVQIIGGGPASLLGKLKPLAIISVKKKAS